MRQITGEEWEKESAKTHNKMLGPKLLEIAKVTFKNIKTEYFFNMLTLRWCEFPSFLQSLIYSNMSFFFFKGNIAGLVQSREKAAIVWQK